jgi:hypothetical protein
MIKYFPLALLLLFPFNGFSQENSSPVNRSQEGYFHPFQFENTEPLSPAQRSQIRATLDSSKAVLYKAGILKAPVAGAKAQLFQLPMKQMDGLSDPGFYSISGYVDHNPNYPNQVMDYNCGNLSYDLSSGYNHAGTDFYSWPFGWFKMEFDEVEVVAAAPGTILYKEDGHYDHNCSMNSALWNAVYIEHADGSEAWYGHLKNGSLTTKAVGSTVAAGEFLGIMGSSGSSTGPHLHFEVYDQFGFLIDPFYGPCNSYNTETWWASQEEYMHSAVNLIATHKELPYFPPCPQTEFPNRCDQFNVGDTVYLATYLKNFMTGDTVYYQIFLPNTSLWSEWYWVDTWPDYTSAWLYYWMLPGGGDPVGMWNFRIIYKGISYDHPFFYGVIGKEEDQALQGTEIWPNPANDYIRVGWSQPLTENTKASIYDAHGRMCDEIEIPAGRSSASMPASKLANGLYFLHIQNKSGNLIKKINILH